MFQVIFKVTCNNFINTFVCPPVIFYAIKIGVIKLLDIFCLLVVKLAATVKMIVNPTSMISLFA
jgi:hypothetical protein